MTSVFISASEIKEHRSVSYKTAYKIFNRIVKRFNIPKERELSVKCYCEYYNLNEERVYKYLEVIRANKKSAKSA